MFGDLEYFLFSFFVGDSGWVCLNILAVNLMGSACFTPEKVQSWLLPYTVGILDHAACRFSMGLFNF